jgi:tetratricopeptide (TPR) repeat protein
MINKHAVLVAAMLAVLTSATVVDAQQRNRDREAAAATQNLAPVPASQAEADAYNAINAAADPAAKVATVDTFLTTYPMSQLSGFANRQKMTALIALGRFREAVAAGEAGLAFETTYVENLIKRADADAANTGQRDRNAPPPLDKNAPAFQQFLQDTQGVFLFYYQNLMNAAQQMDDAAKTVEFAEQAYAINPGDLFTLITLSSTLAERPPAEGAARENALKRADEVGKKAVDFVTALVSGPQGAALPAAQKAGLLSTVHSTMGLVYLHQQKWADSEKSYVAALSARKDDPVGYYRLGLAYGKQTPPKMELAMEAFAKSAFLKGPIEADARSILTDLYQQEKKSLDGLEQFIQAAGAKIGQ